MINEKSTKSEVLVAVIQDGCILQYASKELQGDRNVVLVAVNQFGMALQYASEELRDDSIITAVAVYCDRNAVEYISKRLKATKKKITIQDIFSNCYDDY